MDLVLFGIQGSGKGTQAKLLAAEFGFDIFETGGELRKIAASGTELGNTVKSFIDRGELAPLNIVMQVVKEAIQRRQPAQKILFDGIPRDLSQMTEFDQILSEVGRTVQCIELHVNEEESIKRIAGRAQIEGRADDANEEFIRRRINLFHERTKPVIEHYRQMGNMIDIDGDAPVEEVFERIKNTLSLGTEALR